MTQTRQAKNKVIRKKTAIKHANKASEKAVVPPPQITPLIGISLDRGVFLIVSTPLATGPLVDFRLASEQPFSRVIAADAKRCHVATTDITDDKSGEPRRVYVAFVPTPSKAIVSGLIHACGKHLKDHVFFNIKIDRFDAIDQSTLRKLLFVLHEPFEKILEAISPECTSLRDEHARIGAVRKRQLSWKITLDKVKKHLNDKEASLALALLEPLVYAPSPQAEAEKLLGDMLLAAAQKTAGESTVMQSLERERLLLEHALRRLVKRSATEGASNASS
jgi:hypothetical protein